MLFERAITPRDINYQQLHLTVSTRMGEHHLDLAIIFIHDSFSFIVECTGGFFLSQIGSMHLWVRVSQFIVATGILFSKFSSFCGT